MDEEVNTNIGASGSGQSPSQSSRLCHACLFVLTRHDFQEYKCYPHHDSLKAFIAASRMRCYICSWMLSVLPESYQESLVALAEGMVSDNMIATDTQDSVSDSIRAGLPQSLRIGKSWLKWDPRVRFTGMQIRRGRPFDDEVMMAIYLNPSYKGYFPLNTRVYDNWLSDFWVRVESSRAFAWQNGLELINHKALEGIGLPMALPSNTGSMENWSAVEGWIQECSQQHRCMEKTKVDWYPTRLVETTSDETFRVIRSDSSLFRSGQGQRYITLSHRWGNDDFLKLTTNNLSSLENGLPVKFLRKVFQDTLVVAQRMNIAYIWIDSLCIIQSGDDQADWRNESEMMEQIYSNSFCNISADSADESNGLFFDRTPTMDGLYSLQMRWKSTKFLDKYAILAWLRRILKLKPAVDRWHIVRLLDLVEDVVDSPLNHRGWVLQERLLAPRVLHFSHEQVTWECAHNLIWEKVPVALSQLELNLERPSPLLNRYWDAGKSMQRLNLSDGSRHNQGLHWCTLVGTYTRCDLTKHTDKLVAFAGVARRLAPAEGQYVAGLWAQSMPGALLWQARHNGPVRKHSRAWPPVKYYTPTFSWAAADGEVDVEDFPGKPRTTSATFIKHRDKVLSTATETTLTDHIFGPITSPVVEVRVRGILRSCRRVPQLVSAEWRRQQTPGNPSRGCACPSSSVDDDGIGRCFENGTAFGVSFDRRSDERADTDSTMYYYTVVAYSPNQKGSDPDGYQWASGLLLRSVDESMARFERVGYMRHAYPAKVDLRVPLGNERDLPAWDYDETTGEHTFYIV